MSEKLITVKFTARELYELDCLLANGVCDFADPSNKVAASAYNKISLGWRANHRSLKSGAKP